MLMVQRTKHVRNRLKITGTSVKMVRFVDSLTVAAQVMLYPMGCVVAVMSNAPGICSETGETDVCDECCQHMKGETGKEELWE